MPDITIGRLRGGLCAIWYEGGKRRRYQLEARTRADAEAEAIRLYRRLTDVPKGGTVAEIWEAYRADLGKRPTAETMRHTGKAILPHFGAYVPQDIDKALCVSFAAARDTQGKAPGTIWTELGHLRSALKWAETVGMIDRAPHIWRPAKPETDKRILNKGEMRALVDAATAPHVRLALILLLGTAARVGAVLDLTWDRVSFERGDINLRLPDATTRKGRAVVPMSGMTRAALQTARDAALSDYVIEYAGGPVRSIRKGVEGAIERAGIGHVRIHDLRHTAAVTMLSEGVDLPMVSQMLGHSNTAITYRTYARYLPQHMQSAADVLDFMQPRRAKR